MYFKQFNYEAETSSKTLSETPTDMIDVAALLQNRPFWVSHFGQKRVKPKILILACSKLDRLLYERLAALQEVGFRVVVDDYGHFNPLNYNHLIDNHLIHYNSKGRPNADILLKRAAEQFKVSRDELLLLDDKMVQVILKGNEDWQELDNYETIDTRKLQLSFESLTNLLKEKNSEIKSLIFNLSVFSGKETQATLDTQNLTHLTIEQTTKESEHLIECLDPTHLKNLISLDISIAISIYGFNRLLPDSGKTLKFLNLDRLYGNNISDMGNNSFDALEVFKLCLSPETNLSLSVLSRMFKSNASLKRLVLSNVIIKESTVEDNFSFAVLEELDLSRSFINPEVILDLIKKAPKLNKLYLPSNIQLTKEFISALEELKHIEIHFSSPDNSNCASYRFLNFLKDNNDIWDKNPHFKCSQSIECYFNSLSSLPPLTSILVEPCNKNDDLISGINDLVTHHSNLRHLRISYCFYKDINTKFNNLPQEKKLNALTELSLDYRGHSVLSENLHSGLQFKILNYLYTLCPNLKKIRLDGFILLENDDKFKMFFNGIEELSLTPKQVEHSSSKNLNNFLRQFNELKSLSLAYIQPPLLTLSLIDALPLTALESISFNHCKLPMAFLQALHLKAPHITIDFNNTSILDENNQVLENDKLNLMNLETHRSPELIDGDQVDFEVNNERDVKTARLPEKPREIQREKKGDANTKPNDNKVYHIDKIFFGKDDNDDPSVNHYRWNIFDKIEVNSKPCDIGSAFTYKDTKDVNYTIKGNILKKQNLYSEFKKNRKNAGHYFGRLQLKLTNQWQLLPSLSAQDVMLSYELNKNIDIEIAYDQARGQYFIRKKAENDPHEGPVSVQFDWIVKPHINDDWWSLLKNNQYKGIREKIESMRNYQNKELEININEKTTGQDYLDAIEQQEVGACRHRAILFQYWMQKNHPKIETRILSNDCHQFIEIQIDSQWVRCDLGGYPAKLELSEKNNPALNKNENKVVIAELGSTGGIKNNRILTQKKREKSRFSPISERAWDNQKAFMLWLVTQENSDKENKRTRQLVYFQDSKNIPEFRHELETFCKNTSRDCFYINSKDDLICSAPYITCQDDNSGVIHKGPGGPLYNFLRKTREDNEGDPVLIINYDNFTAQDIVRFNALLDQTAQADGVELPKNLKIIGLMNPSKPNAYQGSDFLSRFDGKTECPFPINQQALPNCLLEQHWEGDLPPEGEASVQFYSDINWEERLLGRWIMEGEKIKFEEGALLNAIRNKQTLHLINAPVNQPDFIRFLQQSELYGELRIPGHAPIKLPENFKLPRYNAPGLKNAKDTIEINQQADLGSIQSVLNPGQMTALLGYYECKEQHLYFKKGLIEKYAADTLLLYMSASISKADWGAILEMCRKHKKKLQLRLAPNVRLPSDMEISVDSQQEPIPLELKEIKGLDSCHTLCIQSSDADVTIHQLKKNHKQQIKIFNCSEVLVSDLLMKLKTTMTDLTFSFSEEEGALLTALKNNETVILTGSFDPDLQDGLNRFFLERLKEKNPLGKLIVVSESKNKNQFALLPQARHIVTPQEKKVILEGKEDSLEQEEDVLADKEDILEGKQDNLEQKKNILAINLFSEETLKNKSLSQLRVMHQYEQTGDKQSPWAGLDSLPPVKTVTLSLDDSDQEAKAFDKNRMRLVSNALKRAPFVFLAGMTGVGKTTFIDKVYQKSKENCRVLIGEEKLSEWATLTSSGEKVLFIDEANIGHQHWSAFEGLFQDPPGILIGNVWHPLTAEHKVIFAGNPLSYGGERQMPSLFARHGNTVIFEPLSPAYCYENMLKEPLSKLDCNPKEVALPIVKVLDWFNQLGTKEVLITPRELTMIALLTTSFCLSQKINDSGKMTEIAQYYAYELAINFVPQHAKETFNELFKPKQALPRSIVSPPGMVITKSNRSAFESLQDMLLLRQNRRNKTLPPTGGLAKLDLEGMPGIGKTELVKQVLVKAGLKERKLTSPKLKLSDDPGFYVLQASATLKEKEDIVRKAFDEGAIVVEDEGNSAPSFERLRNALLMGKNEQGELAKNPGFLMIGTQNPASMAGRNLAGSAEMHRKWTIQMPDYESDEMIEIAQAKGLSKNQAEDVVSDFYYAKRFINPKLCFRDFIKAVDNDITATYETIHKKLSNLMEDCFHMKPPPKKDMFDMLIDLRKILNDKDKSISERVKIVCSLLYNQENNNQQASKNYSQIIEKDSSKASKNFVKGLAAIALTIVTGVIPGLIAIVVLYKKNQTLPHHFFQNRGKNLEKGLRDIDTEYNLSRKT